MKRIMALDVGFKRIGVALSDPLKLTAYPFTVIERKSNEETFRKLLEIIESKQVETVVIGVPINREGKVTKIGEKIKKFGSKFKEFLKKGNVNVDVTYFDESYTTLEAEALIRELKKELPRDSVAAALLLRSFLENAQQK